MRATTVFISGVLFISGLLVGYLYGQLRPSLPEQTSFEIDELATPSIFRRTTKLQYGAVPKGSSGKTF